MLQARSLEAGNEGLSAASAAPRVLVIDDDHLHRLIVCRAAAKAGYVPAGAAGYEEAAKLAREVAFDCITLDLSLGAHAGVEMLRLFSVLGCKAPIIIISGCDYSVCRETVELGKLLDLKVCEPVPKPVDLAVLRHSLEQLKAP